ncbi:MAG: hypothetical protein QOI15_2439 [Pseudonocardiales bacterium]|nr:hypothetical protein [Pseudonocardiales bacterium]
MARGIDRRNFLRLGATAVGASVLGGLPPAAAAAGRSTSGKPRIPGSRLSATGVRRSLAYLGVYRPLRTPGCSEPESLESRIGRNFAINHHFRSPPETEWAPLRDRMLADKRAGRIPMLSYAAGKTAGYSDDEIGQRQAALARLVEIAHGDRDAYLDGQAAALAALGTPVFLRFTWEFDIRYFGATAAEVHRAAWRHTWSRFQHAGATNVAFVWCPTWLAYQDGTADRFYPGNSYVDWIAADGYARSPDYRPFATMFTAANVFALNHGKPFMVAETGVQRLSTQASVTSGSTRQSSWLDAIGDLLDDGRFANMKALVYFHTDGDNEPQPNCWRVTVPTPGPAVESFTRRAWQPRLKAVAAAAPTATAVPPAGAAPIATGVRSRLAR